MPRTKTLRKKQLTKKKSADEKRAASTHPAGQRKNKAPELSLTHCMQSDVNHIYFYESVSRESVDHLIKQLRAFQEHTGGNDIMSGNRIRTMPSCICLHIHSYGGEVFAGIEALQAIESCTRVPVITLVDGIAASAATWLAIAGKRRFMMRDSFMLIHELISSGDREIKWSDIKTNYQSTKKIMKIIKDIYVQRTPLNGPELDQILTRDLYWDADQCRKHLGMEILAPKS